MQDITSFVFLIFNQKTINRNVLIYLICFIVPLFFSEWLSGGFFVRRSRGVTYDFGFLIVLRFNWMQIRRDRCEWLKKNLVGCMVFVALSYDHRLRNVLGVFGFWAAHLEGWTSVNYFLNTQSSTALKLEGKSLD